MNNIYIKLYRIFGIKFIFRKYFRFLEEEHSFIETKDENLSIPEWLRWGVCYTNGKVVIVVTDDIRDKEFVTIIYHIQSDFKIPYDNKSLYYTLEEFLKKKEVSIKLNEIRNYGYNKNFKKVIDNTAFYLKKYIDEIIDI